MPLKPTLTLAHSPDADDVVMWWPLGDVANARPPAIDTGPWLFQPIPLDIQQANLRAIQHADLDITALSAHAYPHVQHLYRITATGGSFGENYGPKLVARDDNTHELPPLPTIAVPGTNTTAFLILSLMLGPGRFKPLPMPFHQVAAAVADRHADAGVLIHEAQLTFQDQGLRQLTDLGHWWNQQTGLPLPLGLNVIHRSLDTRFAPGSTDRIARILAASVHHAITHRDQSRRFLLEHPDCKPEWEDAALLDRYLRMYVSPLSQDMGTIGRDALATLFRRAADAALSPPVPTLDIAPT